jgi:hypothetical protein
MADQSGVAVKSINATRLLQNGEADQGRTIGSASPLDSIRRLIQRLVRTTAGASGHNASVSQLIQKSGRTMLAVFQHPTDERRFLPRQRAIFGNGRSVCHV